MKTTIQLSGLDCANCAAELEREIAKIDGVLSANLSFVNQKLAVEYANDETLKRVLFVANHFESVKVVETTKKQNERGRYATNSRSFKKQWWIIAFSSLLFLTAVLLEKIANGAGVSIARNV